MSVAAFVRVTVKDLKEDLDSVERGILDGVKTFDEYLSLVGKRKGLLQAIAVIDDTAAKFEQE